MNQTFNLLNTDIMNNCVSAIVESFEDGSGKVVTIKSAKEARTAAQLRLKWMWMGQLAKELIGTGRGLSKDGWNRFFKDRFMKALLIDQDEDYADFYKKIEGVLFKDPNNKWLRRRMIDLIQTEWLDVKHMSEYLDIIYHYSAKEPDANGQGGLGVQLHTPDDLKWLRNE